MIGKKIEEITEADLQALIDDSVREGKKIEYKRELPNYSDSGKKEFLADVTSFANSSGGDLIFGIEEDSATREPKSLLGLDVKSIDEEITRLDHIIRNGVEPKVPNHIQPIRLANSKYALVIRVPRSWRSPHRVILGGHAKFYARTSSGKEEMDVDALRTAFNLSETLMDRVKNFREDRIAKILADETPISLGSPHRIVLHLLHANAFNPGERYDLSGIFKDRYDNKLHGMNNIENAGRDESGRYNLDGLLTYPYGGNYEYVQLYRCGVIEAVETLELSPSGENKLIRPITFEKTVIKAIASYLSLMSSLSIEPPIFIFLSLLNVKDYKILVNPEPLLPPSHKFSESIDREMLLLPGEIIESYETPAEKILKPLFDSVWNACGQPGSPNYDSDGNRRVN